MRDIRVATVQFQHFAGDKPYNLERVRHFVEQAKEQGVELIAFPEMCITGYWHVRKLSSEAFAALAEPVPDGPSSREVRQLSREHGMTIGAGLVERGGDGKLYNSYLVAMPDDTWAVHRKLHVFEHADICAGDRYTVFDTPHGCRVGVLICYDNNIVENARATALLGAEILLAPHQTGGCNSVSPKGMKPVDRAIWERRTEDPTGAENDFRAEGTRLADALAAEPRPRQRNVPPVQQRHRCGRRRGPHGQRDDPRPIRRDHRRVARAGGRHGRGGSGRVAAAAVVRAAVDARAAPRAVRVARGANGEGAGDATGAIRGLTRGRWPDPRRRSIFAS
jgi:hypothetical protein